MHCFVNYDGCSDLEVAYIAIFLALSIVLSFVKTKGYWRSSTVCVAGRTIVVIAAAAQLVFDLTHGTFWENWCSDGYDDRLLPFIFLAAIIGFEIITRGYDAIRNQVRICPFADNQHERP